jgi:hypothetical protein
MRVRLDMTLAQHPDEVFGGGIIISDLRNALPAVDKQSGSQVL